MHVFRLYLLSLLCLSLLSGCDRTPLGTSAFHIELVSPDASEVQLESQVDVAIRVIGPMAVDGVTIAGIPADFDQASGIAQARVDLSPGRNLIEIRATNPDQEESQIVEMVHVPYEMARISSGSLPEARVDATATLLDDDRVLVAGGISTDDQSLSTGVFLSVSGFTITASDTFSLEASRAGHTASLLPDGRVLLLGGSDSDLGGGAAEVIDPATETSETVTFDGPAIDRTHHATHLLTLEDVTYLHAIGGTIPASAGTGSNPSGTIDILRWHPESNTLEVLSPSGGTGSFLALDGLSTSRVNPDEPSPIMIAGLPVEDSTAAYGLHFEAPGTQFPFSISDFGVGQPNVPRAHASFTPVINRTSLLAGGIEEDGNTLGRLEIGTETAFFSFPDETELHSSRSNHSATLLDDGRILIVGGRNNAGVPLSTFEMFIPRRIP